MRALKVLVIVMGVILVAGIGVLGFAVAYHVNQPRPVVATGQPTASTIDLPEGARVVGAEATGDRLVVRVELNGGGQELIVVDLATGKPVSTVTLQPKAASP